MSEIYDDWERLVRAVLRDMDLKRSGLRTPSDVSSPSFSLSSSPSFSSSSPLPQVSSIDDDLAELSSVNRFPDSKNKRPSVGLFLREAFRWIGRKRYDVAELYPGGLVDYTYLKDASNNFDPARKIGGVGNVYKTELDGIHVAVKQLSAKSKEGVRELITAIFTISALRHPNLATPMGFCAEKNQLLLVYKYMENISLQQALFGSAEVKSKLNWKTRAKICLGVAMGLAYLHHETELEVIHGNIKPTNILLDKDFTAKIDFGYSQFHDSQYDALFNKDKTTLGSLPKANIMGHTAPEQIQGLHLTPKADVFSFGIVTLELVSGQEIWTLRSKDSYDYLLNTAYKYQQEGNLIALVDPSLESNYKYDEVDTMLHLAMQCVSPSFDLRPTMSDVVKILEGNKKVDNSSTSTPPVISEPIATVSQSTQSGSTSHHGSKSRSWWSPFHVDVSDISDMISGRRIFTL